MKFIPDTHINRQRLALPICFFLGGGRTQCSGQDAFTPSLHRSIRADRMVFIVHELEGRIDAFGQPFLRDALLLALDCGYRKFGLIPNPARPIIPW
jgi:hypothetical protein